MVRVMRTSALRRASLAVCLRGRNHGDRDGGNGAKRRRARGGARGGFRADAGRPRRPGADGALCAAVDPAQRFRGRRRHAGTADRPRTRQRHRAAGTGDGLFRHGQLPACGVSPQRRGGLGRAFARTARLGRGLSRRGGGTGRAQPVFGLRRGGDRLGRWRDRRSGHRRADMVAGPGRRERDPVGHPDRAQHLPARRRPRRVDIGSAELPGADGSAVPADRRGLRPPSAALCRAPLGPLSRRRDLGLRCVLRRPRLPERPQRGMDAASATPPSAGASWTHRRRYRFPRRLARRDLPPLAGGVLSPDPVDGQRGHRHAARITSTACASITGATSMAQRRFRGPTGAPGPSRRSTGSTSPIPAWHGTRP
jgi:hypothetical protein